MYQRLREKGWSEHEIAHLHEHFSPTKEARLMVGLGILLLAIGAMIVPYAYGLLGRVLTEGVFFATLAFIGIPLGAAFALLLVDFARLQKHHHLSLLILTPLIVLFTASFGFSRINTHAPSGAFTHNALIGALVYAIAFILPYAAMVIYQWNSKTGQ